MNYLQIDNVKIELTNEQVAEFKKRLLDEVELSTVKPGEVIELAGYEFIVLEQLEGGTAVILKDLWRDDVEFRDSGNNFDGSNPDKLCKEFEEEFLKNFEKTALVLLLHNVDLTSDDGLKDYGVIERKVSLLTAEQYRKYVEILDKHKIDAWWWLSTPHSTKTHDNDNWIKCVSPSGYVNDYFYCDDLGVRPFCILNSNIFVSCKE